MEPSPSTRFASLLAALALVAGVLAFTGWVTGLRRLTDWDADGIAQMPNNAIAVAAAAGAILCALHSKRRPAVVLSGVTALIAVATLFEHATRIDLGIDTLLIEPQWGQRGTVAPGRMGIPASVSLTVISAAVVMLLIPRLRRFAVGGGVFATGVAMLSVIGYVFGADPLYSIPRLTSIALQTSSMLLALGVALVVAVPEAGPMRFLTGDSAAAVVVRRALPAIVVVPVALGWLRVRGQELGLFDTAFGTALLVIALIALLVAMLFWSAGVILRHESDVRQSRDRLAAILASITEPFLTVDDDWRLAFVNDEAQALLREPRESLLGRTLWDVASPALAAGAEEHLRRAMTERTTFDHEPFRDADDRWYVVRAFPMANGGLALHWRDVTDRKAAEEALRTSADALRAADRMKDEFLATLSHELRTPLTSIVGWSHMLLMGTVEKRDQQIALDAIRSSAKAQAQLIEDVLDVSRITTGKMRLERAETDLANVIDAAVATVRPAAEAKRMTIRIDVDRSLPPMFVDPERVQQVVWNLLSNAIKFSPERTEVEVVLRGGQDGVTIEVGDQGPGIASDFLPHIFERFRQADSSSSRQHTGLGIGLALTRDLVELHGGVVEAKSELGRGSRFVVRLPLPDAPPVAVASGAAAQRSDAVLRGVRVLYVDDRDDARVLISRMLAMHGADVVEATSVDEALDLMSRATPDVVVTDLAMPVRDGFDLLQTLRSEERWSALPVLALTAQGRIDDEARAFHAGFRMFLRKPIEPQQLADAVSRAIMTTSAASARDPESGNASRPVVD